MDERVGRPEDLRSTHFGERIQRLRRLRMEDASGAKPRSEAWQVAAVAACLTRHGSDISRRDYRSIEAGETLPDDPIAFLTAVATCLSLSEAESNTLLRQVSYDIVRAATDERLADEVFG